MTKQSKATHDQMVRLREASSGKQLERIASSKYSPSLNPKPIEIMRLL